MVIPYNLKCLRLGCANGTYIPCIPNLQHLELYAVWPFKKCEYRLDNQKKLKKLVIIGSQITTCGMYKKVKCIYLSSIELFDFAPFPNLKKICLTKGGIFDFSKIPKLRVRIVDGVLTKC